MKNLECIRIYTESNDYNQTMILSRVVLIPFPPLFNRDNSEINKNKIDISIHCIDTFDVNFLSFFRKAVGNLERSFSNIVLTSEKFGCMLVHFLLTKNVFSENKNKHTNSFFGILRI